jgi:hypothetical protein
MRGRSLNGKRGRMRGSSELFGAMKVVTVAAQLQI